jgi:putative ABC transport system permease protein
MFQELAGLAVGNLFRARARLAMTSGGVVVGTSAVILLIALTIGLQRSAEAGLGNSAALTQINVYPAWEWQQSSEDEDEPRPELDVQTVRSLWRIPGVAAVIPFVNLETGAQLLAGDYAGGGFVQGLDPALLPYLGVTPQWGSLTLEPGEIIVGANVGEFFYDPTSENFEQVSVDLTTTPVKLQVFGYATQGEQKRDIRVSAVLQPGTNYDFAVLMNVRDVLALNEWASGQEFDPKTFRFSQVMVRATSRETTLDVTETIRETGLNADSIGEFLEQMNNFFVTMRLILGGVGGVALLVAAFGVANTMMMAILERTKEIGLMKAIGATDRDVLTVFLIEAGLVGLSGGIIGVGLALFLQNVINRAVANIPADQNSVGMFLPFNPSQIGANLMIIPTELWVFGIALATLVGVGAGLYPALRAARLTPVTALKME